MTAPAESQRSLCMPPLFSPGYLGLRTLPFTAGHGQALGNLGRGGDAPFEQNPSPNFKGLQGPSVYHMAL
ncbi:Olfactory Receptor 52B6 [Manis pentadactyla]|nr:Olfactory Receptor 52B6 [Manis pentadactyla]